MSDKKTIVSLGLRRSGKTNYIAAALVYMATRYSERKGSGKWYFPRFTKWTIEQKNVGISGLIDGFEDHLKQGKWYGQTPGGGRGTYFVSMYLGRFYCPKYMLVQNQSPSMIGPARFFPRS